MIGLDRSGVRLPRSSPPGAGPVSRRRKVQIYILWRLDWNRLEWEELGRSVSESWTWAQDLRPLAIRALSEARSMPGRMETPDVVEIAARIASVLDCELKDLESEDRDRVVAVLHDQLAARLAG